MDIIDCPECGARVNGEYTPALQEYPGASWWPASWYYACPCGWEDSRKDTGDDFTPTENTRGW